MPSIELASTFAESRQILKSDGLRPVSISDRYRAIGEHLGEDFSPIIRLLDMLPVFASGPLHAELRRAMAKHLAAVRPRQLLAMQQFLNTLPSLLMPGAQIDLLESFVRPLWQTISDAGSAGLSLPPALVSGCAELFDSQCRLRRRIEVNEAIREFIATDPEATRQRLIVLGQSVLGTRPFIGSMTLSLHAVFSRNVGKPLHMIPYPARFAVSSLPATDRVAAQTPEHTIRCVLHSDRFSAAENDEAMYGMGEHACLSRAIANDAWTMVTARLAGLTIAGRSSSLVLRKPAPVSDEDFLNMADPFTTPQSLKVEIED